MRLIKATAADNQRLLQFYTDNKASEHFDIKVQRQDDFFGLYKCFSNDYVTYILENAEGALEGLVSLVFRDGLVRGKKEKIGFASDLRISGSRRATLSWSELFLPALQKERDERNCRLLFSVVADAQRAALNTFLRPRSPKRQLPRYYSFRNYQLVSIHGIFPFAPKPLDTIQIRRATTADIRQISHYLFNRRSRLPISFIKDAHTFEQDLQNWKGLNIGDFFVAVDWKGEIIGVCGLWNPANTQSLIGYNYDSKMLGFRDTLKALSYFGITHRLSKEQTPLQYQYITHLAADNADIIYSMLYSAFRSLPKEQFLVYTHFNGQLLTKPSKAFIHTTTKYGLYCILGQNEALPEILKPSYDNEPPDFEAALF